MLTTLSAIFLSALFCAVWYNYRIRTSGFRDVPGPKNDSWVFGHFLKIWKSEPSALLEEWKRQYGPTFKFYVFFGQQRLWTLDHKAIHHVIANDHIYEKPEAIRYSLARILGAGLVITEGEKHKQQRRVMNPAFGPVQIRELTEFFVEYSLKLRDAWFEQVFEQGGASAKVDVLSWLSRTTLDVIGRAGFNYEFNALKGDRNELNQAMATIFKREPYFRVIHSLRMWMPVLRLIPMPLRSDKEVRLAQSKMMDIGKRLVHDTQTSAASAEKMGEGNKGGRDLLSLLVRANMSKDIHESLRMSDEDVLAQVPTFFVAGHETTSTATTWALLALSQHPGIQTKLREELFDAPTDTPTMDELNALTYLDCFVKESLRVYSPVRSASRVATVDDVLPLGTPFIDSRGVAYHEIHIKRGSQIVIPITAMNHDLAVWGSDALEFRPERWLAPPEGSKTMPGIWSNQMTFLGGHHACIGYRFAIVEMKALLFVLLRAFKFEEAVPASEIMSKSSFVRRPFIRSDPQRESQLPMIIRPMAK
ncbi:cytochrome P450 [Fistulina hepatica ATCC 64428]|uniref:Cytochrome P450 n=1 Tax=Fistulina hepatica ATCC 64428 TaxID=1128425 RepID=A0A0D7AG62_9AGAR|nr:cytochrome P450 [Fistulina hepatica ATCC 64428]